MKQLNPKRLFLGFGVLAAAILLTHLLSGPIGALEQGMTSVKYHLRGESQIDSSVVILYLSGDDIASLGGIPLKRSFYALILDVLHQLGAKAVGVDVAFTEPDLEHPEYDEILSSVVRKSGNVVLGGYFRSLVPAGSTGEDSSRLPGEMTYSPGRPVSFPRGGRLERPFPKLLEGAAGFGHTTLLESSEIPLFVKTAEGLVPALSFDLLRVALGSVKSDVHITADEVSINGRSSTVVFPLSGAGSITPNFPGGNNSLNLISTVDFLKAYDERQAGGTSDGAIDRVRGKIVLLGIIAGGRSPFISTPFSSQFPSIGLHATLIHDALRGSFLRSIPGWLDYLLTFLIGCACIVFMQMRRQLRGIVAIVSLLVLLLVVSFIAFSAASIIVPVVPALFCSMCVAAVLVLYRHKQVEDEGNRVDRLLRDKEARLNDLEAELAQVRQRHGEKRGADLAAEIETYKREIARLQTQADDLRPHSEPPGAAEGAANFAGIVYNPAGPMEEIIAFLRKISDNDANVLVLGESGTGKELVARAIHSHSPRAAKPFVAVNCGALTETLLESELFGHERGAFTGAVRERQGRFELADGGTILLDEIAETSEAFQVKLLRVLQDGSFERVGGTKTLKVDVRVIAATNRDLRRAVSAKEFREDLYYRLNVFSIHLPPLRERAADIPLLLTYFMDQEAPGLKCSTVVVEVLRRHPWKGNVRELQSVIKRAAILAASEKRDMIRIKDLPDELASTAASAVDIEQQIIDSLRGKQFSRNAISETADELGGFNRGTVTEYLRGYSFKTFKESGWNIPSTVAAIAGSDQPEVRGRVEKKLLEYLGNAVDAADPSLTAGAIIEASRAKFKNLPQRYHPILDELLRAYTRGEWSVGTRSSPSNDIPNRLIGDDPA